MPHQGKLTRRYSLAKQEVCDATSGSVRIVWVGPCGMQLQSADQDLQMLCRQEAIQHRFLRTAERFLQGEHDAMPLLGAWRRRQR